MKQTEAETIPAIFARESRKAAEKLSGKTAGGRKGGVKQLCYLQRQGIGAGIKNAVRGGKACDQFIRQKDCLTDVNRVEISRIQAMIEYT